MNENKSMEDVLMQHLSHPDIDKTVLRQYSSHLAATNATFKWQRIWWIGIPYPEILNIQTTIPFKDTADIQKLFSRDIASIEIFPLGIPFPEELQAIIKIPLISPKVNEGRF